jgi:hypothetical protein
LTKIFEGAIIEAEVSRMKKTVLLAIVAAIAVLTAPSVVGITGIDSRKTSVSDEFKIQIVQPLQIECTYPGDSRLGPGMSSNVAYLVKNNLDYPIEVKYFVEGGPYINFIVSISREIAESPYSKEVFLAASHEGSVGSTFVVNPQEQLYFFVKYTISKDAPAPAETFLHVTLEESRILIRG